jgi:hypothetical protein
LRAFERLEERLKKDGPRGLTAYMPLIAKYDLHVLEMCRSAEELAEELARSWVAGFMLRCEPGDPRANQIVEFFKSYDVHKSHGRGISRERAREVGLNVQDVEVTPGLPELVRSLYNQYELWFEQTSSYKNFENAHGISWGRYAQQLTVQLPLQTPAGPPQPAPQPGPPKRAS